MRTMTIKIMLSEDDEDEYVKESMYNIVEEIHDNFLVVETIDVDGEVIFPPRKKKVE